ncbi:hypothetical protein BTO02_03365 [Paraburkholderia sp. SOS3]|nr:hypothetical protein BTO02_03365 [Paraburkholderia sp. SOS3]
MRCAVFHDEQSQSSLPGAVRSAEPRIETFEQRRASLTRTLCDLEALAKTLPRGSLKRQSARARVVEIQKELRVLKGKMGVEKKNQNLGDFLIQMFKERVTKAEWDGVVAEARRRYELQEHCTS